MPETSPAAAPGAVVERLRALLGEPEGDPVPLDGGITNRNLRLRAGGVDYVVRLPGKRTDVLGIDREAERAANEMAAAAGAAPAVAAFLPDEEVLVTRFVAGGEVTRERLREPATLIEVATRLRAVHGGPALRTAFSPFRVVEDYLDAAAARGAVVPTEQAAAAALAAEIEPLMAGPEHAPVPCHNDLLAANFIADDERLWIVDWEYAGMGDRYFDLANLSVNTGFDDADDERLLEAYFEEPPTAPRFACLRLMRLMSDYREAMWGVVQTVVSELDFDFAGYAAEHFARLRAAADDPRYPEWVRDARAAAA
jgi:thiamine kinase-like enzyme